MENKIVRCESNYSFIETQLKRESAKLFMGVFILLLYTRLIFVLITRRKQFNTVFYSFLIVNGVAVKLSFSKFLTAIFSHVFVICFLQIAASFRYLFIMLVGISVFWTTIHAGRDLLGTSFIALAWRPLLECFSCAWIAVA